MPNYETYAVALAFHAQQPGGSLANFDAALFSRFDNIVRSVMASEHGVTQLSRPVISYLVALTALSAGTAPVTKARKACSFFQSVQPPLPGAGQPPLIAAGGPVGAARRRLAPATPPDEDDVFHPALVVRPAGGARKKRRPAKRGTARGASKKASSRKRGSSSRRGTTRKRTTSRKRSSARKRSTSKTRARGSRARDRNA